MIDASRGSRSSTTSSHVGPPGTNPARLETTLPPLLTTKQAARLLGAGERTLWRWSRSGVAPAPVHINGAVRYRRDEYLAWIADGCPRVAR